MRAFQCLCVLPAARQVTQLKMLGTFSVRYTCFKLRWVWTESRTSVRFSFCPAGTMSYEHDCRKLPWAASFYCCRTSEDKPQVRAQVPAAEQSGASTPVSFFSP